MSWHGFEQDRIIRLSERVAGEYTRFLAWDHRAAFWINVANHLEPDTPGFDHAIERIIDWRQLRDNTAMYAWERFQEDFDIYVAQGIAEAAMKGIKINHTTEPSTQPKKPLSKPVQRALEAMAQEQRSEGERG